MRQRGKPFLVKEGFSPHPFPKELTNVFSKEKAKLAPQNLNIILEIIIIASIMIAPHLAVGIVRFCGAS